MDQSATPLATERDDRVVPRAMPPAIPVWLWPGVMIVTSLLALRAAWQFPAFRDFWLLVPYTYVGNSLARLPYDPTIVYLAQQFPLWTVAVLGVTATVILGRGMRYTWLGALGVLLKVPAWVLVVASLLFLIAALRGYLTMNRAEEAA